MSRFASHVRRARWRTLSRSSRSIGLPEPSASLSSSPSGPRRPRLLASWRTARRGSATLSRAAMRAVRMGMAVPPSRCCAGAWAAVAGAGARASPAATCVPCARPAVGICLARLAPVAPPSGGCWAGAHADRPVRVPPHTDRAARPGRRAALKLCCSAAAPCPAPCGAAPSLLRGSPASAARPLNSPALGAGSGWVAGERGGGRGTLASGH